MEKIITENGCRVEQSISGYWMLLRGEDVLYDDSACEDLNEDKETAEAFFAGYLRDMKVSSIKTYNSNMEVYTEGAGCFALDRDHYSVYNKDEAREELMSEGFLLEDIETMISTMETYEWLSMDE